MNQITKLATITDKSLILATNTGFLSVIKWRLVCVVTDTFRKEPGHFSVAVDGMAMQFKGIKSRFQRISSPSIPTVTQSLSTAWVLTTAR